MLAEHRKIVFEFKLESTLDADIEPTELLFIDTLHTYSKLSMELARHSNKASKYLILHDIVTFGLHDEHIYAHADEKVKSIECNKKGLIPAVFELLEKGDWQVEKYLYNNNGLLILKRHR